MSPRCTWDSDRGWLTPEHVADCATAGCAGCRPCGKSHCAMRGRCANHVDHSAGLFTCAGCIGRTRGDLQAIEDRYAEIPAEALEAGVNSEAANLAGPAASPEQRAARRRFGQLLDEDDPHHPYAVLGRWDMALREDYDQPTDLLVSVSRAKDYLAGMLSVFAQDQPQAFEEFSRDVATCRTHLESVLSDSRQPERGAPCPTCKDDADPADDDKPPRLVREYHPHPSGAFDRWQCPRFDEHKWSEADYRLRIGGDYLKHATALTASQLHDVYGIRPGTLRKQAERKQVAKRGLNASGQMTYDVKQARALHGDGERMGA